MAKCFLDSNLLVYWKNELAAEHTKALETLEKLRQQNASIFISPLVLDEFIHTILLEARINESTHDLTVGVSSFVAQRKSSIHLPANAGSIVRQNKLKQAYQDLTNALKTVLELPLLTIINPPTDLKSQTEILVYMEKFNLRPRDAYHLLTMQANGIDSFATFDNDFARIFEQKILFKA